MPTTSDNAIIMALYASLPRPENLNILTPIPRKTLPSSMIRIRRIPIFFTYSPTTFFLHDSFSHNY